MEILSQIFLYMVLPLVGIGLIVFSVTWRKNLTQRPVEIAVSKLGLNLKTDTLTILILLGAVMASAGAFFIFQGYEKKIENANEELQEKGSEIEHLRMSLDRFKVYSMPYHLIFKSIDSLNTEKFTVQVYNWKQGKGAPLITSAYPKPGTGLNELWVTVENLNPGDEIRIIAYEDENKPWQSVRIEVPETDLLMTKVKQ